MFGATGSGGQSGSPAMINTIKGSRAGRGFCFWGGIFIKFDDVNLVVESYAVYTRDIGCG